jgi:hypothetical protein
MRDLASGGGVVGGRHGRDWGFASRYEVLFKIFTKVLTIRSEAAMLKLINDCQNAFIRGRFITDGVMLLQEILNERKYKKQQGVIRKIDFEKAYDKVNWDFLFDKVGMGTQSVSSVMRMRVFCTFSLLVQQPNLCGVVWPDQLELPLGLALSLNFSGGFLIFFLLVEMFKLQGWHQFAGPFGSYEIEHVLKAKSFKTPLN